MVIDDSDFSGAGEPHGLPQQQPAARGRGTGLNPHNRYSDRLVVRDVSSDAMSDSDAVSPTPIPRTQVTQEQCRSILTRNQSPDIPFEYSLNPYRGCEHGCIYCYARTTHAYWDLSPGLDFETRIISKPNAASLLEETLRRRGYRCQPVTLGANTDPYQPVERRLGITRSVLEVFQRFRHPVSIITKGELIRRDIDILSEMAAENRCSVAISVTTLDDSLKRVLEPRATSGSARLTTIRMLADAGIPVTMLVAPVIPFINDAEMDAILTAGREAGASAARYILIRLPLEIADLFRDWLAQHFPDRADRVMNSIRSTRNGKDYESGFGVRMTGEGVLAKSIAQRFQLGLKRHGYGDNQAHPALDTTAFRLPEDNQLTLF